MAENVPPNSNDTPFAQPPGADTHRREELHGKVRAELAGLDLVRELVDDRRRAAEAEDQI